MSDPLVMFGLGAAYQFLLRHRLPIGSIRGGWHAWTSAMATNLAIAVAATGLIWFIGIGPFLLVHLPVARAVPIGGPFRLTDATAAMMHDMMGMMGAWAWIG